MLLNRLIPRFYSTASAAEVSAVVSAAERLVSRSWVSTSEVVRQQHSHDESHHADALPDVVATPADVAEVAALVRLCAERRFPIIPFGTGTGLEGGVTAPRGGLSLDLCRLTDMSVHEEDFDVTIGAGVLRQSLNKDLRATGLWFPIDPGADASLCGMAATSASGTNAVRYGTMRENVNNLQVVLPNGEIIWTRGEGRRARKSSAGLNITNLFVGSEGTLGVITAANIRLYPIPEQIGSAVSSFPTVESAVKSVVEVLQCAVPMARIEFLDEVMIEAANNYSHLELPLTPHLFLEFHGSATEVEGQVELVRSIVEGGGGSPLQFTKEAAEREALWAARHACYYAAMHLRPGSKVFTTDVCVPISRLPQVLCETKADIDASGLKGPIVGHVGDGNFHVTFPVFPDNKEEMEIVHALNDRMIRRALAAEGTCTGEHGVGLGKRKYMEAELGGATVAAMKAVKAALDPHGLMNPDKIFASSETV